MTLSSWVLIGKPLHLLVTSNVLTPNARRAGFEPAHPGGTPAHKVGAIDPSATGAQNKQSEIYKR